MNDGLDLAPALTGPSGAWAFIGTFAAGWTAPLADGDGTPERDLAAAERRLGLRLPAAVREAYRLFGRRDDLHGNHDVLRSPGGFEVVDGALVFRDENQGAARWGVRLGDPDRDPDPPTLVRADLADAAAERWEPWIGRFSAACAEMVLSESLHAPEELSDQRDLEDGEPGTLLRVLDRLPSPGYRGASDSLWLTGPDLLLRADGDAWLSVRARTEAALARFRDEHPGAWLNG